MRLRIKNKIIIYIVPFVFMAFILVAGVVSLELKKKMMDLIEVSLLSTSQEVALNLEIVMNVASRDTLNLSRAPSIYSYNDNIDYDILEDAKISRNEMELFLTEFISQVTVYDRVRYFDKTGTVIVDAGGDSTGQQHLTALELALKAKKGDVSISPLMFDGASDKYVMYHITPVVTDEFKGGIILDLNWSVVLDKLEQVKVAYDGFVMIGDRSKNQVLCYPPDMSKLLSHDAAGMPQISAMLAQGNGQVNYISDGFDYTMFLVEIKKYGWTVGTTVERNKIMAEAYGVFSKIAAITAVVIIVLIIVIITVAKSITEPISELVCSTAEISSGNLNQDINVCGRDELGQLSRSFVQMRDAVRAKIKDLDSLQSYLASIINSMPSILIGINDRYEISQWNAEAEKVTGVTKEKALGEILYDVFPQLVDEKDNISEAITTNEIKSTLQREAMVNGSVRYEDITIYPLIACGTLGAVIRIDDVTTRQQLEKIMIQTEKMQSVGGLAAGMAHEINNPLAAITQGIQNITRRLDPASKKNVEAAAAFDIDMEKLHMFLIDRKILTFLDGGREAVKRAAQIVKNMLMFARKTDYLMVATDMAALIDHTIELGTTDYDMKKKYDFKFVDIIKEYDDELPLVNCCPSEIEQVLLNLFKNGVQAMENIKNEKYKPQFYIRLKKEADFIRIEVEDNGPGIQENIKQRVCEPFFTTKPVGIGTGLGLSVSYMIINQNHGGTLDVESEVGAGTKFIIRLPLNS